MEAGCAPLDSRDSDDAPRTDEEATGAPAAAATATAGLPASNDAAAAPGLEAAARAAEESRNAPAFAALLPAPAPAADAESEADAMPAEFAFALELLIVASGARGPSTLSPDEEDASGGRSPALLGCCCALFAFEFAVKLPR